MKVVHLHTGTDGRSHFDDFELNLVPDSAGAALPMLPGVQGVGFRELVAGFSNDYHNAARRQLVIQLSGAGELICGDGTTRVLGAGEILLADDVTGQGHVSREVSGPRSQLYVYLDPSLDLRALRAG